MCVRAPLVLQVVDIVNGQITAMTAEGVEKFFNVPSAEHGPKLVADFTANAEKGGDQFYIITVLYAPRMVGKKWYGTKARTRTHTPIDERTADRLG